MVITKMAIPRRTFLRGAGVTLALPFLDAMFPALSGAAKPIPRLGFFYVPNGMSMPYFRPKTAGANFELSPILGPLAPHREYVTAITGVNNSAVMKGASGPHSKEPAAFLTGATAMPSINNADVYLGTSADQIAARVLGQDTVLESLELSTLGYNDNCGAYACAYKSTLSWRSPTTPNPMEVNPRVVFERLFGNDIDHRARAKRMKMSQSILDGVTQALTDLKGKVGSADRVTLDGYFDAVRSVERRIEKIEAQTAVSPDHDRPLGIPSSFDEHVKQMVDLLCLAYQADLTRVATFMMTREGSVNTYPLIGVPETHHEVSHHGNDAEKIAKQTKINTYHIALFTRLVEKMRQTPDGDGTLLDHAFLLYGAGLGDGDLHSPLDIPLVLVGGGCGTIKGNRHLTYTPDQQVPISNLLVSVLNRAGVPVEQIGDSSGELTGL